MIFKNNALWDTEKKVTEIHLSTTQEVLACGIPPSSSLYSSACKFLVLSLSSHVCCVLLYSTPWQFQVHSTFRRCPLQTRGPCKVLVDAEVQHDPDLQGSSLQDRGWGPVTAEPVMSYGQLEGESRTSEILSTWRAGVDSPPYRVSYLRCRKRQAHVGRSTLGRYANTALGRLWEVYSINVYRMPRLREVGHFGI